MLKKMIGSRVFRFGFVSVLVVAIGYMSMLYVQNEAKKRADRVKAIEAMDKSHAAFVRKMDQTKIIVTVGDENKVKVKMFVHKGNPIVVSAHPGDGQIEHTADLGSADMTMFTIVLSGRPNQEGFLAISIRRGTIFDTTITRYHLDNRGVAMYKFIKDIPSHETILNGIVSRPHEWPVFLLIIFYD